MNITDRNSFKNTGFAQIQEQKFYASLLAKIEVIDAKVDAILGLLGEKSPQVSKPTEEELRPHIESALRQKLRNIKKD